MIDFNVILEWAGKLTVVGILLVDLFVVVVGLQRRWWLPYYIHAAIVTGLEERLTSVTADRDKWQGLALRGTDLVEAAVGGIRRERAKARDA
jgi:hypothetical protein